MDPEEKALREEVERRLGRPFERVQDELCELFGREWEDVEIAVSTSSDKSGRSEADVIVDLVGKAEEKPSVQQKVRRRVVRWIGKPWRERENPWDRYKDRIPGRPPPTDPEAADLEEWTPLRPEEE